MKEKKKNRPRAKKKYSTSSLFLAPSFLLKPRREKGRGADFSVTARKRKKLLSLLPSPLRISNRKKNPTSTTFFIFFFHLSSSSSNENLQVSYIRLKQQQSTMIALMIWYTRELSIRVRRRSKTEKKTIKEMFFPFFFPIYGRLIVASSSET